MVACMRTPQPIETSLAEAITRDAESSDRRMFRVTVSVRSLDDAVAWGHVKTDMRVLAPTLRTSETGLPMVSVLVPARDHLTAEDFVVWRVQRVFDARPELRVTVAAETSNVVTF
jgi:hypothetical protein